MPTLTVELTDELYGFVMGREGTTPDETIGAALRYMEFEERGWGNNEHLDDAVRIAQLNALLDEGEASGTVEGNVFEQISIELGLPYRKR